MTNVLVCVKRVPDSSSEVVLTDDGQSVDGRFAGFTTSVQSSWPRRWPPPTAVRRPC